MRSKIIAMGLSALTAGTFALTAMAPAAHADIVDDVCAALPGLGIDVGAALSHAGLDASTADSTLSTKQGVLASATTAYVDAVVDYLQAAAAGTSLTAVTSALNLAGTNIGNAFVDWANANAAAYTAHQTLSIVQLQQAIVGDLGSGLGCTPV
jgi:hypothetical protein